MAAILDEPTADVGIKSKEKNFIMIPNEVVKLKCKGGLTWEDLVIYGKIKGLCNKHGHCWATNKHLAEFFNTSTETIQRSLRRLRNQKLISIKMNYKPNTFHVESRHITVIPIK
jgi:predicted HTH transcriptional regulator